MRYYLILLFILLPSLCFGADVPITWREVPEATGYKIYISTDCGQTWDAGLDVGMAGQDPDVPIQRTYTYTGVPENTLILFKGSAYNAEGEGIRDWSGAWYDHRLVEE